jgi:hypothetical protein
MDSQGQVYQAERGYPEGEGKGREERQAYKGGADRESTGKITNLHISTSCQNPKLIRG